MTELAALVRATRKLGRPQRGAKALPSLLAFTDPKRSGDLERLTMRLPRGAALVYRAFGAADAPVIAMRLRRITWRRQVLLVIGADAALARAVRADGLHLPERMMGAMPSLQGRFRLLTVATHSPAAARRGFALGADAVVISPVLASDSPSAGTPLGVLRLAAQTRALKGPVIGLGGILGSTARRVAATGVAGLAAVGAFAATD